MDQKLLKELFSQFNQSRVLLTGGCGFIGTNLIDLLLQKTTAKIANVDKICYAATTKYSTNSLFSDRYKFFKLDLLERRKLGELIKILEPNFIIHCAAESHVDNSILSSQEFLDSNIIGTYNLLECTKDYVHKMGARRKDSFRFLFMSTDEVYGDAENFELRKFTEESPLNPSSPYAASKASGDALVSAWHRTYSIPAMITRCSNNFGQYQHFEKFIPKIVYNSVRGLPIPLYGDGQQIRDWIYVNDHIIGVLTALTKGLPGEVYNISSENCIPNKLILKNIHHYMSRTYSYDFVKLQRLIFTEADRKGHDRKYSLSPKKIREKLGWKPVYEFTPALEDTVKKLADNYLKDFSKAS